MLFVCKVLDKYIQSAIKTLDKSGNSSTLLRNNRYQNLKQIDKLMYS